MKKGLLLILPLVAGMGLAGCDLFKKKTNENDDDAWIFVPEIEGGSDAEKNAILRAVNDMSVCINRNGGDLFPTSKNIEFTEDEQDYIQVANKVIVDDLTVDIKWDFKESQATFDTKVAVDETTDIVYIKYPGVNGSQSTFNWSISEITCGKAKSTKTNGDFTAKVIPGTIKYNAMTIEQILAVEDTPEDIQVPNGLEEPNDKDTYTYDSRSGIINYESFNNSNAYSPWWNTGLPKGTENNYIYASVKGKVVYLSEDGNWGLLANGNHVIEIYSGNQLDLNAKRYPELKNEYVEVKGEINHYYGNFQVSFIKSIRKIASSQVTEPTLNFATLNEAKLTSAKLAAGHLPAAGSDAEKKNYVYKQFTSEFEQNSLAEVTGTITGDKVSGSNGRFTFEITVGECKLEVAYDYHSDKESKVVKNALNAKYSKGSSITIKGTLRFSHGQEKSLIPVSSTTDPDTGVTTGFGLGGNWSIVPFAANHIA